MVCYPVIFRFKHMFKYYFQKNYQMMLIDMMIKHKIRLF